MPNKSPAPATATAGALPKLPKLTALTLEQAGRACDGCGANLRRGRKVHAIVSRGTARAVYCTVGCAVADAAREAKAAAPAAAPPAAKSIDPDEKAKRIPADQVPAGAACSYCRSALAGRPAYVTSYGGFCSTTCKAYYVSGGGKPTTLNQPGAAAVAAATKAAKAAPAEPPRMAAVWPPQAAPSTPRRTVPPPPATDEDLTPDEAEDAIALHLEREGKAGVPRRTPTVGGRKYGAEPPPSPDLPHVEKATALAVYLAADFGGARGELADAVVRARLGQLLAATAPPRPHNQAGFRWRRLDLDGARVTCLRLWQDIGAGDRGPDDDARRSRLMVVWHNLSPARLAAFRFPE
jgi:hypothetical protein